MKRLLSLAVLLLLPGLALAQDSGDVMRSLDITGVIKAVRPSTAFPVVSGMRTARGYEQLTLSSDASTALASVPANTSLAIICVDTIGVRFRDDGVAPTAAIGMPIPAGSCWTYAGTVSLLRFFRVSASTSVVNALYY